MPATPSVLEQLTTIKPAGSLRDRRFDLDDARILEVIEKAGQGGILQQSANPAESTIESQISDRPTVARVDDLVRGGLVFEDISREGGRNPTYRKVLTPLGHKTMEDYRAGRLKGIPKPPALKGGLDSAELPEHLRS